MWEFKHKEGSSLKTWCFRTLMLEKDFESPLDCNEIQPINPKGNQPWIFIGRTDAEAEVPVLRPPDVKSWLIGKDPDAGKDCGKGEKGTTEDEMVRWHHRLNGHGFGWTPRVGDGQGSVLRFMGSQRVRCDWVTEVNWIEECQHLLGLSSGWSTRHGSSDMQNAWKEIVHPGTHCKWKCLKTVFFFF